MNKIVFFFSLLTLFSLNPFATVIVFFIDFYVYPTMFPIRITPHSRVAHRYLATPSLPNENLKFLKTVHKRTVDSERVKCCEYSFRNTVLSILYQHKILFTIYSYYVRSKCLLQGLRENSITPALGTDIYGGV